MRYGNGPTYGGQNQVSAADIAFSIHSDVDKNFYDVQYPEHDWPKIVLPDQVMESVSSGATTYAYITRDQHGAAKFVGNGPNNDVPMVAQSAGAVTVPVAVAAVGAVITNEDARQYTQGYNGNLAEDLGKIMRKACDNFVESCVIFGSPDQGFQPWINYPGAPVITVATGAGGDTEWDGKTGKEMVDDVNGILVQMWDSSRTVFKPNTLFLPLLQFARLTLEPIVIGTTGTATTAIQYLRQNNIMTQTTGIELDIIPCRYLKGAGAAGADRMVIMHRFKDFQCLPFPMPYQFTAPVPKSLGVELYAEMKIGSYHARQLGSITYGDGI